MGILSQFDLDNVPELAAVPAGEYEVCIIEAGDYVGKESGKQSIRVVFEIMNESNAQNVYHYISLPNSDDDEKVANSKLRRAKQFLKAFDLSSEDDYAEWTGRISWALLDVEDDRNGEARNRITSFIGGK